MWKCFKVYLTMEVVLLRSDDVELRFLALFEIYMQFQ